MGDVGSVVENSWGGILRSLSSMASPGLFTNNIRSVRRMMRGSKEMNYPINSFFTWKAIKSQGYEEYRLPFATVFNNGAWHTWDENGDGGENSKENTIKEAKVEAIASAFHQGFIRAHLAKALRSVDERSDISVRFAEEILRFIESSRKFLDTTERHCGSDPILGKVFREIFDKYGDDLKKRLH